MVQILNRGSNKPASARAKRKSELRRAEILHAAARVFRRRGLATAGMREIAEEADLSPGNLYYYFSGKDEIVYFCQQRMLERMLATLKAARNSARSVAQQLREVLRAHLRYMLEEFEGATAHLEVDALPPELRRPMIARRDAYERAIRDLVASGIERGEFARCDAALVTRAMLGALNWSARWYRPDGPQPVAEIVDAIAEYLVRGLR